MFWGLIVEPKKRYTQTVQASFHVSSAVIDPEYKGDEPTSLFVQVEGQDYAIAILKKNTQTPLDLNLEEGMQISFHSKGSAVIHLTGYLIPMGDEGDEGDSFLDSEAEDEEVSGDEDEDEAPQLKAVKGKKGKAAKEESSDDDEVEDEDEDESSEEEEPQPAKKQKVEAKKEITTPQKENGQQLSKKQLKKQQQEAEAAGQAEKKTAPKTLQGGVMVEDLKTGSGPEAKPGKKVAVYYVGRLKHNNKQFDATQKGPGFKFKLGAGEVIKGWDVGVAGMKVGGKRRIVCPHQMAYGTKGAPPAIPPNSTLVFDVELKAVN